MCIIRTRNGSSNTSFSKKDVQETSDLELMQKYTDMATVQKISYFSMYNLYYFAKTFEGKVRMCIMHG